MSSSVPGPLQGEVWWGEAPDAKGRPYLVLTRDVAIPVLRTILVAPVTRTVREIPTEVPLGGDEGLEVECAATIDNVLAFPRSMLVRRLGALRLDRRDELCAAWRAAADC
ncbi:MAG: type II toxin-antitoxin system PemK/MazF family toxin [Actinomycetota bacterium]